MNLEQFAKEFLGRNYTMAQKQKYRRLLERDGFDIDHKEGDEEFTFRGAKTFE